MSTERIDYHKWRDRVLQLRWRHTRSEDLEFCSLVEQVAGINEIGIVRTLIETFTAWCDTGVQQTVIRILGSFDILMYYRAYIEALPRLVSEEAGWEMDLGSYPERNPSNTEIRAIAKIAKGMPNENIKLFLEVLTDSEFEADHDWAKSLVKMIQL
jgi:hypothetical protein